MKPKRILHIVGQMDRGGQETFIMNLYRNIDRNQIQFDFVVHTSQKCDFDDEIISLGGKIYSISPLSKSFLKHCKELYKIIKENKYDTIHRHTASSIVFVDLFVAKMAGAHNRICHSHNTQNNQKGLHRLFRPLLNLFVTERLACGMEAGKFMFGKKEFTVIPNGINVSHFKFNNESRSKKRKELHIDDKLVITNIGRFNEQKNHTFLIDIFYEYQKIEKNAILCLVGKGNLQENIKNKVKQLSIEDKVYFLNTRNDVNEIMMASDIFLFPSLFEGLPVALIEAQATGLPCLISDTISKEAIIESKLVHMESLSTDVSLWSKKMQELLNTDFNREKIYSSVEKSKYNIDNVITLLDKIYK